MAVWTRLSLALSLLASSACADEPWELPAPPPFLQGRHLRLHTDGLEPVCGGTLGYMDDLVPLLSDALELPVPALFDFHWVHELGPACPAGSGACWDGSRVWSLSIPNDHEFVHVVAEPLGSMHALFREGFAVVYGDDSGITAEFEEEPTLDPETIFAGTPIFDPGVYTSAGHVTRFLVDRHDMQSIHAFWRDLPHKPTHDDLEASFAAAFEETWGQFLAAYGAYPSCTRGALRMKLTECRAPTEPWDGDTWHHTSELRCSANDVIGSTFGRMWKTVTFDIPAEGRYVLEVPSTGYGAVSFARCDAGCDGGFAGKLQSGETETSFELPQGRYYATFWRWFDQPGSVELRIVHER